MEAEQRKRILILVTLLCVGIWVADAMVLTPLTHLWQERAARISTLEQDLAQNASLLERASELKSRWETMKTHTLPNRITEAEKKVLESVEKCIGESKLNVTAQKPHWTRPSKEAQEFEIQVEGKGDIEAAARFIYAIETTGIPIRTEDMELVSTNEKGGQLNITLRFSGLVLEEGPK